MGKKIKLYFLRCLFAAVMGLSFYVLFYLTVELLLTEVYFIFPRIDPWVNTMSLFLFLLIANVIDWSVFLSKEKRKILTWSLLLVSFSFYVFYHHFKIKREYWPKIYGIIPSWVIQAQIFEIRGINFGPTFKKGQVEIRGMEFIVKDWGESKILVEVPVFSKQGVFDLCVITEEGKKSNTVRLEVKDPVFLKRLQ